MSGFTADWLRLREPADHSARHNPVTERLVSWAHGRPPLSVLDLGTGTGSNLRFLAPRLGHGQQWRLIDHDPALLQSLPERLADWAAEHGYRCSGSETLELAGADFSARIECRGFDLAEGINALLAAPTDLVTGSALLDLTSGPWIEQLAGDCGTHGCAVCFALNYDGQVNWQPGLAEDERLRERLNAHQQQAKGLGLALGPAAGPTAAASLRAAGFDVTQVASNWQLNRHQAELQIELASGWAAAVIEQHPALRETAERWLAERRAAAGTPAARVIVGHNDVLGLPTRRT